MPYRRAVTEWIRAQENTPQVVLIGGTTTGRDFAPRLASALETGLTADCVELDIGPHEIKQSRDPTKVGYFPNCLWAIRPAFGESLKATILGPWKDPQMATVRAGVFVPREPDPSRQGDIVPFPVRLEESDLRYRVVETVRNLESSIDISEAKVIVACGYGMGSDPRGLALAKELAGCFDGAMLGASRKAVDAGWFPYPHQVGQTGKTVHPDIYIALGISGSIQHRVGMQESKIIIAVDKNPEANIFTFAHYGIVGDLYEVVPELIQQFRQLKN
jgi:electron transfer flavoprotein alpha subunit